MPDLPSLLPMNGTPFQHAIEQVTAYDPRLIPGIDLIPDIKGRKLPSWLSVLLYEYGLLELTPYVANPYLLLDQGRVWQIERDTLAAITRALGWISQPGAVIEAPPRRYWWNNFQIVFTGLPAADVPNLERIDRLVGLAKPYRSDFRRGVFEYDVPAFEGGQTRLDAALLDNESGVRLRPGGPLWSFGRTHEIDHVLTEDEGQAIDNWLPPVADEAYQVDFLTLTATLDGDAIDIEDAISFERSTPKWHDDLAGDWNRFEVDEIAVTDRGALIEVAAERLTAFHLQFNPLTEDAATVDLIDLADPFGGLEALQVTFDGSEGRTLFVPAEGLEPSTVYSVSFFARLISASGVSGGGGPGFSAFFDQLVEDEWVRIKVENLTTPAALDGQWLDLTLDGEGAVVTVQLFGFQVEAGAKVSSPIEGDEITGERAADVLTLLLPDGLNNVVASFGDGSGQSFLQVAGPYDVDAADLNRDLLVSIGNLSSATWESMAFPWTEATFPWDAEAATQRGIALAEWFESRAAYFRFKDSNGAVIGYRRARIVRQTRPSFRGPLSFGDATFIGSTSGQFVYADAMTDAGNGAGQVATTVELVVLPVRAAGVKPGKLWLAPNEITGGEAIAATPVTIPLRATVRERVKLLLRF